MSYSPAAKGRKKMIRRLCNRYASLILPFAMLLWAGSAAGQVTGTAWYNLAFTLAEIDTSASFATVPFRSTTFDYQGRLWAATGAGLYRQVASLGDSMDLHISPDSNYFAAGRDNVRVVAADSADTDLLFGHGRGLTVLDSADFSDSTMVPADSLVCDPVYAITPVDSASSRLYWIGGRGGLVLYDLDSAAVDTSFTTELPGPDVYDVEIDSNGGVWIATSGGLAAFRYGHLFTYTTANGLLDDFCYCLEVDEDGDIWVGTDLGVSQFDGDTTWTSHTDSLAAPAVRSLRFSVSDSTMWIGSLGGLTAYEEGLPYPESPYRRYTTATTGDSLTSDNILSISIYQDSIPFIYIGTDSTMVRFVESP